MNSENQGYASAQKYNLCKMIRTAVGGETAGVLLRGDQSPIKKMEIRVAPVVQLDGLVHFDIHADYGRAFSNLQVCGKTPERIKSFYLFSCEKPTYGLNPFSRNILDMEDAREIVGLKGNGDFEALDNFVKLLSLEIDRSKLLASGIMNLKALAAYDEETQKKKIAEMQTHLLETMDLMKPQKAMDITLRNPKWLEAAREYTGWLFGLVKDRLETGIPINGEDTGKLIELYSGIW